MANLKKDGDGAKEMLYKDADKYGAISRFGYFSVPYPATIGEGSYDTNKKINKDDKGKVVLHPRNMIISPPKSGNGADVFFSNPYKVDDIQLKKLKENQSIELEQSKKKQTVGKGKVETKAFYPSGPKLLTDYFSLKQSIANEKGSTSKAKIKSVQTKKVIAYQRNMVMTATKIGLSGFPDICFSYPKSEKPLKVAPRSTSASKLWNNTVSYGAKLGHTKNSMVQT